MWKTYVAVLNNDLARNIPNFNNNGDQISSFQVPTKNSFTPIPSFFNYVWMLHCHKKGFHIVTVTPPCLFVSSHICYRICKIPASASFIILSRIAGF